ncbi:phosphoribosylanthranilate isomerase [Breoghania corrubedonensis]|uniref:N-(5'-phosphoribosyl)anthranilate isomerase n=1 Tax=Breoghania corrubedonensis TaxID=665038 RepID=A0A2T5VHK6_9HYPH|nr:phosphoribosylanthranilate isomerase [Breoghania corrubedonensis]PTW63239.1 phosphoribosylanthranilate isomerase [Breoghania corrubedonensis]
MPTLVKICGLSTPDTMNTALEAGADMVGLVFFAKSPRHVSFEAASKLAAIARGRAEIVALTVDADDEFLSQIMEKAAPDWLQLHGSETPGRLREIRTRFATPVMKAFGIRERGDLEAISDYAGIADRILFDSKPPRDATVPGGSGKRFDWRLLEGLDLHTPFMLSGGLDAGNVAEALDTTGARAVDVSSGIEATRGVKDPALIRRFIETVRAFDLERGQAK